MLYVTGDTHGDLERFKTKEAKQLKKGDILLVCGDFGFVWDGSQQERRQLHWLGSRRYQVLFLDGTHDNLDLLAQYPQEPLYGGLARRVDGNCWYLERGEVYEAQGIRFFVLGGGESQDMDTRIQGETWWPQELPSPQELERARENLRACGDQVDYLFTHEPSAIVSHFLEMDATHASPLSAFLDRVSQEVSFTRWYFGSLHLDKPIPPRHQAVYQRILPVGPKQQAPGPLARLFGGRQPR